MGRASIHRIFYDKVNLPHIEIRDILDARNLSFEAHSHPSLELGVMVSGQCTYINAGREQVIGRGTVTIMNPEDVHACIPDNTSPLAFRLFYFDLDWLAGLQHDDPEPAEFRAFSATACDDTRIQGNLERLYRVFSDPTAQTLGKECVAVEMMTGIDRVLAKVEDIDPSDRPRMVMAAEYISDLWASDLKLDDISKAVGLSSGHLIRTFKKYHGMSPYAYLINRRVQVAREMMKRGMAIVDAAYETCFYDQAHFHRAFKRLTGVTPGDFVRGIELASR